VKVVVARPRSISSFAYDDKALVLSAYYLSGKIIECHDVPASVVYILRKTPTPERFFEANVLVEFPCEIVTEKSAAGRMH
jgi:hypothetical protein